MSLNRRQFITGSLAALPAASIPAASLLADARKKTNMIFIIADDLGWADLSCYGNPYRDPQVLTPVLDKLASEGLRFTHAYANSPVCSASRTAIITGRYQYRLRVGLEEPIPSSKSPHGMPPDHPTLPSLLAQQGYHTALIGKWHLGHLPSYGPLKSGYQEFFGNMSGGIDYFTHRSSAGPKAELDMYEGEQLREVHGYYTDLLTQRAEKYLSERAADKKPFFLSLHYTAPHWPWEGPEDEGLALKLKSLIHADGGNLQTYHKMIRAMDTGIGQVLQTLKKRGLSENTMVIFTSDNGGERFSYNWPLSGQKTELLEGGIRVPAIVSWPGRIQPGVSDQVIMGMDWMPTLLAAAQVEVPTSHPSDGMNLLPLFAGGETIERTVFWRYKAYAQRAVRKGNLKYVRIKGNEFLFDLAVDERERANLARSQPEQFEALKKLYEEWDATMLPIPADAYTHRTTGDRQADHYGAGKED